MGKRKIQSCRWAGVHRRDITGYGEIRSVRRRVIKIFYIVIDFIKFTVLSAFFIMLLVFDKTILDVLPKTLRKNCRKGELLPGSSTSI
jgi:hypothetical protein